MKGGRRAPSPGFNEMLVRQDMIFWYGERVRQERTSVLIKARLETSQFLQERSNFLELIQGGERVSKPGNK